MSKYILIDMIQNFKPRNFQNFIPKEIHILTQADVFFTNHPHHLDTFIKIIDGRSHISCRMLNQFVTKFCKINNDFIQIYDSYKNNVEQYSTKYFDPFCRKQKVEYAAYNNVKMITSVGQINFFKWICDNNIIMLL